MMPHGSFGKQARERRADRALMAQLTAFALRHRRWIIGGWLLMIIAGAAAVGQVSQRLSTDFSLPGQPGYETAQRMMGAYGNGGQAPSILTVTVPAGQTVRADEDRIAAAFGKLADRRLRVVDYGDTRDPAFISSAGRTTYALVFAPLPKGFSSSPASKQALATLRAALPPGYQVAATGLAELRAGSEPKGPGSWSRRLSVRWGRWPCCCSCSGPCSRCCRCFASLASAPDTDIKVFATALGAGILLDATVVRALLFPAAVALFGRWNWWLPGPLARIFPARPAAAPQITPPAGPSTRDQSSRWHAGAGTTGRPGDN